jgi:hypothetical protein
MLGAGMLHTGPRNSGSVLIEPTTRNSTILGAGILHTTGPHNSGLTSSATLQEARVICNRRRYSDVIPSTLNRVESVAESLRRNSLQDPVGRRTTHRRNAVANNPSLTGALGAETGRISSRRPSTDSIQRHDERRRSVGDSFAQYNPEQVDLTRLAIQALKKYLPDDDFSDNDEEEASLGSSIEWDSYISEEDYDETCTSVDESADILLVADPGQDHSTHTIYKSILCCTKPLQSSLVKPSVDSYLNSPPKQRKKLTFGTISLREYAVTVGAFSASDDQCPIQLSWEHGHDVHMKLPPANDDNMKSEQTTETLALPSSPRRLSLHERRRRIAAVQGIPEDQVGQLQYDILMNQIQQAMNCISP